jgi:hypothetical protein
MFAMDKLTMLEKILVHLRKHPGLKAKTIAAQLNEDRTQVNRILYDQNRLFVQDKEFKWSIEHQEELCIKFPDNRWLTADDFGQVQYLL